MCLLYGPISLISPVHAGGLGRFPGKFPGLGQYIFQGVAIVNIGLEGHGPYDYTRLLGKNHRGPVAVFIFFMCLALAHTIHFRFVQTVDFPLPVPVLGKYFFKDFQFRGTGTIWQLTLQLPYQTPSYGLDLSFSRTGLFPALGMRVVIGVPDQLLRGSLVAPARDYANLYTFVDDLFVQLGIRGIGNVLLLCRGIDTYVRVLAVLPVPVYGMFEYPLHPLFPYTLSEMYQVTRRTGRAPLLENHSAEVLEIDVHLPVPFH